ncbi:MAG TPA: bifunctional aspartate kinase/homoserine dehydrogenase I [Candidatus Marinimicrobia bacterium]|nr:bifunctional aspartate kinase/homoserine dehydrogenase I [Candidatus Neomarinimicrobiota bacterium]HRU92132.1 bifunctional aspartate kinase/homoserine dehydrogenase I [Candidatus Neomarinimicrobiota bacterium]
MKVLKFGGSSVGKPENLQTIFNIIAKEIQSGNAVITVFSAFNNVTDQLKEISQLAAQKDKTYQIILDDLSRKHFYFIEKLIPSDRQKTLNAEIENILTELKEIVHGVFLLKELSGQSLDLILSFGERLACTIIAAYGQSIGYPTKYVDARQFLVTDNHFGAAHILPNITNPKIQAFFKNFTGIPVVTGFIAATEDGITTTLGRGGSDLTASLIGAALDAEEIQIWKDVNGFMSADPNKVKEAFSLAELSYEEALELSHFGAKVLFPPTIQPVIDKNIPIRILNTFNPDFPGTVIRKNPSANGGFVKGVTSIRDISLLTVQGSGMVGVSGISSRLFGALAKVNVNVILISQASSEHSICVAILRDSVNIAKKVIEEEFALEIKLRLVDPVVVENDLVIIAVVGERMRRTTGLAGRLFSALGEKSINVIAIAQGSSELNISIVIDQKDEKPALNAIHNAFFAKKIKLNLFLFGVGLIGSTLIEQIKANYINLLENYSLDIKVVGLANSRKMLIEPDGIDLNNWRDSLNKCQVKNDMQVLLAEIKKLNLDNNVFVDCTASADIVNYYEKILAGRTSIVTANKIGNTGPYAQYRKFHELAKSKHVHFLYETNAGAALPIISTLRDMINSGDQIIRIEAILSGTISYILNNFKPGKKFSAVVREAKARGFTEPDPRDDLSGLDFARKVLLLVREIGIPAELSDIQIEPLLPENCLEAPTIEAFFAELEKSNDYFDQLLWQASAEGKVLRYIATYENEKTELKLVQVEATHPFYFLSGSDNIVAFTTKRYAENPLVIKGAGAGAEVTAAGVMADIFKIANAVMKSKSF